MKTKLLTAEHPTRNPQSDLPFPGPSRTTLAHLAQLRFPGRILAAALLAVTASGCQSLSYTAPTGERFSRLSFGAKLTIASLSVTTTTNGVRGVELRGYENDSAQALGLLTEAAVRGALAAVAPRPVTP